MVYFGEWSDFFAPILSGPAPSDFRLRRILSNHIYHESVKELAGSYPCVSFLSVEGEIDQLWQAGVEIDVYLGRIEGDCKFESAFRVPFDEVLFFMRTCLLVVDDGVGVPSDFTQQVKNLSGDIFSVKMFVVIIRFEHLLKLELLLPLLSSPFALRVNL